MRVFIQHSNEIAVRNNILESSECNENSRQHWRRSTGIWPMLFERAFGLENENETFLWNYVMFVTQKVV